MRSLFGNINLTVGIVSILASEILLIALLLAFDIARDGLSIVGYVFWSLVFLITFPILLRQWSKQKKDNNNDY